MTTRFGVKVRRACRLAGFSKSAWYKRSTARDQSALRLRIREIAHSRPRFGYPRIHVMLRREGWPVNKKRVYRWYRLEGLQIRMRVGRRKHMCLHRGLVPKATRRNERWSMDFVHDQLIDGRPIRMLTVVDQLSRECVVIEVGSGFTGRRVAKALEPCVIAGGAPRCRLRWITAQFTSVALEEWAHHHGIKLDFIHPGKPTENGLIESINGRLRDECLNVNQFASLEDA
jgi:putative transposase